jgi:hypothetical protein
MDGAASDHRPGVMPSRHVPNFYEVGQREDRRPDLEWGRLRSVR